MAHKKAGGSSRNGRDSARHVVDAFVGFPVAVQPPFDNLHPIEIGAVGIAEGPDHEARRPITRRITEVAAHGHATPISLGDEIRSRDLGRFEIPPGEDAHSHPLARLERSLLW